MTSSTIKLFYSTKRHKKPLKHANDRNAHKPYYANKYPSAAVDNAHHYYRLMVIPAASSVSFLTPTTSNAVAVHSPTISATGHREVAPTPAVISKPVNKAFEDTEEIVTNSPITSAVSIATSVSSPHAVGTVQSPSSYFTTSKHTTAPDTIQPNNAETIAAYVSQPTQTTSSDEALHKKIIVLNPEHNNENRDNVASGLVYSTNAAATAAQEVPLLAVSSMSPQESLYQAQTQQQQSSDKKNNSILAPVLTTFFGAVVVGSCIAFLILLRRRRKSFEKGKANRVYIYDKDLNDEQKRKERRDSEKQQEEDFFAQPPPLSPQQHTLMDLPDTTVPDSSSSAYNNSDDDKPSYAKAMLEAYKGVYSHVSQTSKQKDAKADQSIVIGESDGNTSDDGNKRYTEDTLIGSDRTTTSSFIKVEDTDINKQQKDVVVAITDSQDSIINNNLVDSRNEDMVEVELTTTDADDEKLVQVLAAARKVASTTTTNKHESWQTFITAHTADSIYVDARTSFAASSFLDVVVSGDEESSESDGTASVGGDDRDSWIKKLEKALNKNSRERREAGHQRA